MGGPRRSQSSFVSKRRSEDAVISGDSGKSCNLRGILFVECNNARCEIHFPDARLNTYLRNIGYVATRYDLQSATIKCLETLCYASKRKLRSDKFLGAIATCCSSTFIKRYSANRRNIDGLGDKRIKGNLDVDKANRSLLTSFLGNSNLLQIIENFERNL